MLMAIELPSVEYEFTNESAAETGHWRVLRLLRLDEGLSKPYECELELAKPVAEDMPAFDSLLGDACVLSWWRRPPAGVERRLCGIVRSVSYRGVRAGEHVIRVEIVPALWTLSQRTNSRVFQDKDVREVVEAVVKEGFANYPQRGIDLSGLKTVYPKREYYVQYGETDLAFVTRLLAEYGITYYFSHDGKGETLALVDDNTSYAICATVGGAPIPVRGDSGSEQSERVTHFDVEVRLRSTSFVVREFDWTQPALAREHAVRSPDERDYEREHYEPSPPVALHSYSGTSYQNAAVQLHAQVWQEAESGLTAIANGKSNVVGLIPGTIVSITGHQAHELDGDYLVTEVRHEGVAEEAVLRDLAGDQSLAQYANVFSCVPAAAIVRPPRPARRSRIFGPLTATVVGPKNEEVYTDEHGRIKVQFHWDRLGARNEHSSCWIRVAQSWGGAGLGTMFIPRVGMEVVTAFLDGDPDRPLVVGCVYNGTNLPPHVLPDEKTKSYIHTKSSPDGMGFNELSFEDAKGSEQIYLHAEKDLVEEVKNDHHATIGGNESVQITGDQSTAITGKQDVSIDESLTIHVKGSQSVTIDGGEAAGGVIGGKLGITGDYKVDASNTIEVQAPASIRLTCGGSSIFIEPGKITLQAGGGSKVVLDVNAVAESSQGSKVLLDANALAQSSQGSQVLLDANALLQSTQGSKVLLDANALAQSTQGSKVELNVNATMQGIAQALVNAPTADLTGGGGSVQASAAGVTAAGGQVNVSGGMVNVAGGLVRIN